MDEVILHCAGIKTGQARGLSAFEVYVKINRQYLERGYRGFGYHGLIMPDGEHYSARPYEWIGGHVRGRNVGTIGLLLVESVEITRLGEVLDWFTEQQCDAAVQVIRAIPGVKRVNGHNDHAQTLCPGFKVQSSDWL